MFDGILDRYDSFAGRLDDRLPNIVMLALGALMIVYGIITGWDVLFEDYAYYNARLISSVIIAVFGLVIIVDSNRTMHRVTLLFAFSLGLYRSLNYYFLFKGSLPEFGSSAPINVYDYALSIGYLVMLVISLMMFITAAAIAIGFSFRRNSLMFTCMFMVVIGVVRIWMISMYGGWGAILTPPNLVRFIEIAMFILVLWIFDSDEVRMKENMALHSLKMVTIRNSYVADKSRYVVPEVVDVLLDPERSGWRPLMDCGPVVREYKFIIHGKADNRSIVLVQEWRGDEALHVTVSGTEQTTVLFPNRFLCDSLFRDGDDLIFAGRSGVNFKVLIRNPLPTDKFGIFEEND